MQLIDTTSLLLISEQDLRDRYPLVSFPAIMKPEHVVGFGVAEFVHTPQPSSEFGTVTFGPPIERNGTYYSNWIQETLPIEQCKQIQLNKIAQLSQSHLFKELVFEGVIFTVNQQNITLLHLFSMVSETFDFKGKDGWLSLNAKSALRLLELMQKQVQEVMANEKRHHDAIMALTNVEAVIGYDYSQGW